MGEPINIISRVSFVVMKIHAPIIGQDFPFKKNTELPNAATVLKWRLILRLAGNVGISDHWGKPNPFSNGCMVTENQKSIANAAIFLNFLRELQDKVITIWRFY